MTGPPASLDGTGRWLAAGLGWRWVKSRRTAEARDGSLVVRLILQSSAWSRAGAATWVRARVSVLDGDLRAWRLARPDETVFPAGEVRPFACNTMLASVEPGLESLECSGLPQRPPAPRTISAGAFAARFRELVVPVRGLFGSSRLLASSLPDSWLMTVDSGMIEQALARNDRESAAALIRRCMERPLRGHQTWPAGSQASGTAGKPRPAAASRPSTAPLPWAGWPASTACPAQPHSGNRHRNQDPERRHSSAAPAAGPRRNGSAPMADGRPRPHMALPLKPSHPRSAARPRLRSADAGQDAAL